MAHVPINSGPASSSVIIGKREVFYDSALDSPLAKCGRWMTCACMAQKSRFTSEKVQTEYWSGCTKQTNSIDIDAVKDLQLRETCGICLCLCGRGEIRVYGHDADQKGEFFTCKYIENAAEVFVKLSELKYHLDDLKLGMKRPKAEDIPWSIYNSNKDGACLKCLRVSACGCFHPTTIVTKGAITQTEWTRSCVKVSKRFDFDHVTDMKKTQGLCDCCCQTGTIKVYGSDADQKDGVTISWVGNINSVFSNMDNFRSILNNRDRVGFGDAH
eukprot:c39859_g1_i1.p1 GENE.c39859_g1_i1~~c39859_g1_i1.p1  ORF type:complete len:271 (+),score=48.42 c39859_g1_i1:52-864(+)